MIGLAAGLVIEGQTGRSIPAQVKLLSSIFIHQYVFQEFIQQIFYQFAGIWLMSRSIDRFFFVFSISSWPTIGTPWSIFSCHRHHFRMLIHFKEYTNCFMYLICFKGNVHSLTLIQHRLAIITRVRCFSHSFDLRTNLIQNIYRTKFCKDRFLLDF